MTNMHLARLMEQNHFNFYRLQLNPDLENILLIFYLVQTTALDDFRVGITHLGLRFCFGSKVWHRSVL